MTVKVDLPALRTYFEGQEATAKLMLDAAKTGLQSVSKLERELTHGLPDPPRTPEGKIDVPVTRREPPSETGGGGYSDAFRTKAVRLANEIGSDNRAGLQLRCSGQSIGNWRKAGYGQGATSDTATVDDGSSIRCRACGAKLPVDDAGPGSWSRALQHHYTDSPTCEEINRARGR